MGVDIGALAFLGVVEAQGHKGPNHLQHRIGAHADPQDGEPRRLDLNPELDDAARDQAIGPSRIGDPQGKNSCEQGAHQASHTMDREDIEGVIQAQAVLELQGAIAHHRRGKANQDCRQGTHIARRRCDRHQAGDGTGGPTHRRWFAPLQVFEQHPGQGRRDAGRVGGSAAAARPNRHHPRPPPQASASHLWNHRQAMSLGFYSPRGLP